MPFPSTISSFSYPTATDRLNNPSHSTLENNQSSAIGQIETFIGRDGSASTAGTLLYDIRSPDSDGGGHVQTANKGGTGQTTYTKGDILVAQSSSVLSKLAPGTNGYILKADSGAPVGVRWSPDSKIVVSSSSITVTSTMSETSVMSTTIPGSVLSTNNAILSEVFISAFFQNATSDALTIKGIYGAASIAHTIGSVSGSSAPHNGTISLSLLGNSSVNSQRMILRTNLFSAISANAASVISRFTTSIAGVDSTPDQGFGVTVRWNVNKTDQDFTTSGYVVRAIT